MELLSKDITLGFYNDTGIINLPVSQYDAERVISIAFTNDGKRFVIPENTSVFLKAVKPDGKQINTDEWCSIQDNKAIIEVSKQLSAVPGTVKCELVLSDTTGKQYTSNRFNIVVSKSVHNDENLLSTDTYKNIIDILLELDALKKDLVFKKEKDQPDGVPSLDENAKIPRHELYDADLYSKGAVKLVDSVESGSTSDAATPNSVKTVRDALQGHTDNTENPHAVTKKQVGLGNADNTADADKPVSAAQREAIDASLLEAKAYTDIHTGNGDIHVSTEDKNRWNKTGEALNHEISRATEKETEIAADLAKEVARLDEITSRVTYGICETDAETAAKVAACDGFHLADGAEITVKFVSTNIAANPTLNVNGTGGKEIYYKGRPIFPKYLAANGTYTFCYNGAQYELVGDIDSGSGASAEEIGVLEDLLTEDRENLVSAINSLTLSYGETLAVLGGIKAVTVTLDAEDEADVEGLTVTLRNVTTGEESSQIYADGGIAFAVYGDMPYDITVDALSHHITPDPVRICLSDTDTGAVHLPYRVNALNDLPWTKIAEYAETGRAAALFNLHDAKEVELTDGNKITVEIIGFDHDILTDSEEQTAGITFAMKNCLKKDFTMNTTNTNVGGWKDSEMRSRRITEEFYNLLPPDMQSALKQVDKQTSAGNNSTAIDTTADNVWLLSSVETGVTGLSAPYTQEGTAYPGFSDNASRIKHSETDNSACTWFLRSPYKGNTTGFKTINQSGADSSANANTAHSLVVGFCV
ncbi:MAG: phage tail protein [Lachnospiraceae bacterium]|nr:phage tail protein [Lachnospiraceae bacterium]